ncbi:MAG: LCP family protein [Acutalibacteraceae bacterium]|nr:LCP family protein [Acutalibacteraceae bacterium]
MRSSQNSNTDSNESSSTTEAVVEKEKTEAVADSGSTKNKATALSADSKKHVEEATKNHSSANEEKTGENGTKSRSSSSKKSSGSGHHSRHHSRHHSGHHSRSHSGSHSSGHHSRSSSHKSTDSDTGSTTSTRANAVESVTDDSAGTDRHIRKRYTFSVKGDNDIPVAVYHAKRRHREDEEEEQTKKNLSKPFKIFIGVSSTVVAFLLVTVITFTALLFNGKNALIGQNSNVTIAPPPNATVEGEYIVYNDHKYKYNNKVTSILLSGIDMHTDEHQEGVLGTAGQADTVLVLALNTETGKYKVFSVSRDTMVDVNICDEEGNFTGYEQMQLCLAHAYGGGGELSNENLKRSVSRIFFGIPMNSYMSIDLDAIPVLNDAVGGVTVTVIEDLTQYNSRLVKGATVTLNGDLAEIYVRSRDIAGDANQNTLRMDRQESYLEAFIHQAIFQTKHNIRTPLNLYSEATPYARTDIDASRVTYLASILMESGFSTSTNYTKVPGEAVAGKEFAEYYVDTDRFFKMVLDTYFIKVE